MESPRKKKRKMFKTKNSLRSRSVGSRQNKAINEAALLGIQLTPESVAFRQWIATSRLSKSSTQHDLPQSRLPVKHSLISANRPQLFLVVDTCSICKYRGNFIEFVTETKQRFPIATECPLKLIMSLPVIEELDSSRKQAISFCPSQFVRFLEEEMRTSHVMIGEFDPGTSMIDNENGQPYGGLVSRSKRQVNLSVQGNDDRILDCCLRAKQYIKVRPHHSDTKVILITEDNLFKTKATTYNVVSYRWLEFIAKFRNFGLTHFQSTPQVRSLSASRSSNQFADLSVEFISLKNRSHKEAESDDVIVLEHVIRPRSKFTTTSSDDSSPSSSSSLSSASNFSRRNRTTIRTRQKTKIIEPEIICLD